MHKKIRDIRIYKLPLEVKRGDVIIIDAFGSSDGYFLNLGPEVNSRLAKIGGMRVAFVDKKLFPQGQGFLFACVVVRDYQRRVDKSFYRGAEIVVAEGILRRNKVRILVIEDNLH